MKTVAHDFHLPIANEDHLRKFVRLAFGVTIPDKQVCDNHTTPWRAFADAYFARSPVTVWKASRGFGGKSYLLALLGLTEAVSLKADVNVLGGSGEQSGRVHEYMQGFWDYASAPRHLLASDPSKRETNLVWGNSVQALMASQASVRGPHPQRLRLDEADEMKLTILDAALGQPMGKDGVPSQTVISSTHQYADGTFTEMLKRAKQKGWGVQEWCYRETMEPHGWLPVTEVEEKRGVVTAAMWSTEYDLQEPSPEARAIQPGNVAKMFDPALGEYEGREGQYIEIEPPVKGGQYATGGDWARKVDWTAIVTLRYDVTPMRVVAFERMGRRPWPVMVGRFDQRLRRYPGPAYHDGTGIGDVVAGYMESDAEGLILVGRTRSDVFSEYIAAIERDEIESAMIDFMESEHKYASVDDIYGRGHPPDSFVGGALAYRAATKLGLGPGYDDIADLGEI